MMLNVLLNRRSGIFFFSSAMIIMDDGGEGKGGRGKERRTVRGGKSRIRVFTVL